ncbi:helix-turn-helix domain-containing protein [Lysinibacillus fusiformis]
MKHLFSIGEVAHIKGVTIKALRYYHQMGILIPAYIDRNSGYRYYSIDQFIYIDIIKACRILGTNIKELQKIFSDSNTDDLLKFLALKRYETEENIKKMKEVMITIDKLNNSIRYAKEALLHDDITIQHFEKRFIITAPCNEVGGFKEILYYSHLDKKIEEKNIETTMENGIAYTIKSDSYLQPSYVFRVLCESAYNQKEENIDFLPEGNYLTLTYRKENEEDSFARLQDYVNNHKLKINKYIEVELLDDIFNTDSYSCQIQLLIDEEVLLKE